MLTTELIKEPQTPNRQNWESENGNWFPGFIQTTSTLIWPRCITGLTQPQLLFISLNPPVALFTTGSLMWYSAILQWITTVRDSNCIFTSPFFHLFSFFFFAHLFNIFSITMRNMKIAEVPVIFNLKHWTLIQPQYVCIQYYHCLCIMKNTQQGMWDIYM